MGGTITLNGKTYNLSLISAVYTERILQANSGGDMLTLFGCLVFVIMGLFLLLIGQSFLGLLSILFFGGGGLYFLSQMNTH